MSGCVSVDQEFKAKPVNALREGFLLDSPIAASFRTDLIELLKWTTLPVTGPPSVSRGDSLSFIRLSTGCELCVVVRAFLLVVCEDRGFFISANS
jgi:hypothetical protein